MPVTVISEQQRQDIAEKFRLGHPPHIVAGAFGISPQRALRTWALVEAARSHQLEVSLRRQEAELSETRAELRRLQKHFPG